MRAGVALGSNLHNRLGLLHEACRHLQSLHETGGPFLRSRVYETEPVDCPPGSPPFFNAVVEFSTLLPPLDLLSRLQDIEVALGRPRDHAFHAPRTIDLDLLYLEQMAFILPGLTLPHPRIGERLFVLCPLADVAPERILPGWACPVREILGKFPESRRPSAVADLFSPTNHHHE